MRMAIKTFLALVLLASSFYAVPMLEPFQKEISSGDEIYLGEIGPGQTISMSFDGRPKAGGMYGIGGAYDIANVSELPAGWAAMPSDWDGIPLQVKITAAKDAPEGEYRAVVNILDVQYEGLQNVSFFVKLNVTHDVLDASLDSSRKDTLSGQPASFYITISNKASTGDVFTVSSSNVPKWAFKKYVYVPAKSSKTVQYEVMSAEEARYSPRILIVSESSSMINKTLDASVNAEPSLTADYKATNNGMIFFPAMSGILYSLAGLISNLF
ncbi:Uncharacterised protein [uncultured archaeon]|nr:Uncharacterised protein [uncultured archaeon]